ncbi:MAG: adenylate/guanylate cyclase domain-containing protein [Actinomycetota bacterium]
MIERPDTQYARFGDLYVAYQVFGSGPVDLLILPTWVNGVEAAWDTEDTAELQRALGSFARVITFDLPGTGLSDPVSIKSLPSIEEWMQSARVVMDAAGVRRAAVLGFQVGGTVACVFAATYPGRISSLILVSSYARLMRSDDYPEGLPERFKEGAVDLVRRMWLHGDPTIMQFMGPSEADDLEAQRQWIRNCREAAGPGVAEAMFRMAMDIDVRHVLPLVKTPTLVLHRKDDRWIAISHARYLARNIKDAKLVELEGADNIMSLGDRDALVGEVRSFLAAGSRQVPVDDRVLATILFTDIVSSTEQAARLGDHRWRDLLDEHDRAVRALLHKFRGREVKTTGDGFLATFDGPARAIRCAKEIAVRARDLGLEIRAGLHTGEVEMRGDDVGGIAVHAAARVMSLAGASEVLVSSTVKDLVAGSGIEFAGRGAHALKGVPGEWALFAVESI